MVDEEGGCGSRGFHTGVGYHIQNALVAVVTDAGDDGDGEVGNVLGQCQRVEATHVARCTATSYYYDAVKLRTVSVLSLHLENLFQCIYDALLHTIALHDGGEEARLEAETVGIVGELVAEVAVAGGGLARYHGDALTEEGQTEFALQVEDAFLLQLADDLLTLAGHIAKGIGGVDVGDDPGETVGLVELRIDLQQHLHAGVEALAGGALEPGTDEHPLRSPAAG